MQHSRGGINDEKVEVLGTKRFSIAGRVFVFVYEPKRSVFALQHTGNHSRSRSFPTMDPGARWMEYLPVVGTNER